MALMLPLLMLRRLHDVGIANTVIMILTMVSIGIMAYYCYYINTSTMAQVQLVVTNFKFDPKEQLTYWNLRSVPLLIAGLSNSFEGNKVLLNIYSEAKTPQNFCAIITVVQIVFTIVSFGLGVVGYLTFKSGTESFLLLNMPTGVPMSIAAKCLYILTIVGSYIIQV